eukprot:7925542-Alexandrium_andersonii.AAC.1
MCIRDIPSAAHALSPAQQDVAVGPRRPLRRLGQRDREQPDAVPRGRAVDEGPRRLRGGCGRLRG